LRRIVYNSRIGYRYLMKVYFLLLSLSISSAFALSSESVTKYSISHGEIRKSGLKGTLTEVMTQALITLHPDSKNPTGYQITNIVKNSVFEKLHLKNKDVLLAVNGETLADKNILSLWTFLDGVSKTKEVKLNLSRSALGFYKYCPH